MSKRLITIDSRGPIPQKSGVQGPITRPYYEDVRTIARMIVGRIVVTEHLADGAKRTLTVKDIPALTADAPKVLKANPLAQAERTAVQELAEQKKQELLAAKEAELEAARKEVAEKNNAGTEEGTVEPPAEENTPAPVEKAEAPVQKSALSKKERRELAAKEAAAKEAAAQETAE